MKRYFDLYLIATAFAILFFTLPASAQYEKNKPEPFEYEDFFAKNVVKFNPLGTIFGNYSFAYERVLPNNKMSLQLGGSYMQNSISTSTKINSTTYPEINGNVGAKLSTTGFSITPEFRYYYLEDLLSGKYRRPAPYGLYVGAVARYFHNDYSLDWDLVIPELSNGMGFSSDIYTIGLNGGFHGVIGKHVSIDMYMGPNYNFVTASITRLPQAFEEDSLEDIAYNWALNFLLDELVGSMSASTNFPGVRAGITIGAAF